MSEPTRTHPPDADPMAATRVAEAATGGDTGEVVAPQGYEILGEIGRGGMGAVYRARDLDLARDVAVKILLPQYAPDSATARRFMDEARITGRLQHPGIPSIYRVGALADGRPFLAMKLIGGRTLDELLKSRTDPNAKADPALPQYEQMAFARLDRLAIMLESGRFLAIFEHVAQAVGYAHQEGVIHRDLKPANVMVGAFGEVQVMDWGVARSGERRPEAGESKTGEPITTIAYAPVADSRTPQSDLTQAGAILGTPAYMPPEQAIGAIDQIGKHSDVFGLGAILCVILTGKPPYVGADAESNRQLAARAKLDDAFARLDASKSDPELIALAKRCLAPEPKDRPRDAGEVAEAVAALRADSERRARQAEMDRARAEVKRAEERKRRRVLRALALAVLGLVAVAAAAGWWIDHERTARRADHIADDLKRDADARDREAAVRERQLATERDVAAALNEVQLLLKEGRGQAEDPARWALTLATARSSQKRAEALLAAGEPTPELPARVAAAAAELQRDDRDRALLARLDRVADSNEIRLLMPAPFTSVTSRQYESAFREHIDLLEVPTAEAVAWLKGHRFRDRLAIAVRNWRYSLPQPGIDAAILDPQVWQAVQVVEAVASAAVYAAIMYPANHGERLKRILNGITDEPFQKQWWDAIEKNDVATLKKLMIDPEIGRMSSRALSSLADGLNFETGAYALSGDFLRMVYDRYPGEFWVNLRLGMFDHIGEPGKEIDEKKKEWVKQNGLRHLTAAVASRPKSGVARTVLAMQMLEIDKDDPAAVRVFENAAEVDPTSPWPHLFLGMHRMEKDDWPNAAASFIRAVRADPDPSFVMVYSLTVLVGFDETDGVSKSRPTDEQFTRFIDELIALHPAHPGGYTIRADHCIDMGDYRGALAAYRRAAALKAPDFPGRLLINQQLAQLEAKARWEGKVQDVLDGKIAQLKAKEIAEIASYCAQFDKKYSMAVEFIAAGRKTDPTFFDELHNVGLYAGWAVQASVDSKLSDAGRSRFRKLAYEWLVDFSTRAKNVQAQVSSGGLLHNIKDLAPVRDAKELAKLPADERDLWEKFWKEHPPYVYIPPSKRIEPAPPPRPGK